MATFTNDGSTLAPFSPFVTAPDTITIASGEIRQFKSASGGELSLRKELNATVRYAKFKYRMDATANIDNNHTLFHVWGNAYTSDLVQILFQPPTNGGAFRMILLDPSIGTAGSWLPSTGFAKGVDLVIEVIVTDTGADLKVNGTIVSQLTARSWAGKYIGVFAIGSFYSSGFTGIQYIDDMYFDTGAPVTAPVRTAPPTATNVTNWYNYGALPNKTVAQLRTITFDFWNNRIKPYIITTGMPTGMPTGAMRVYRPENSNDTVSEGMGYGMIGAVYLGNSNISGYDTNGKTIFDNLWKYVKYYLNSNGLMSYRINSDGTVFDGGGATDADYDIAWALHMAHKTWGSTGAINYASERDAMLTAILNFEHYSATHATTSLRNVMINGDLFDTDMNGDPDIFDPDYFAPAYMQEWANLNPRWSAIRLANYPLYYSTDNFLTGLIPDHQKRDGTASTVSGLTGYKNTYNAIRRFRQVLDYLWYGSTTGSPNYKDYYQHVDLATFISGVAGTDLTKLYGEYTLDGSSNGGYTNNVFKQQYMNVMLLNSTNSTLAGSIIDNMVATPDGSYFGDTVTFMGLLTASGLFKPNPPAVASVVGRVKVRIAGSFVAKPVKARVAGSFVQKPVKKRIGGSFTSTTY